jgi:hypothetical protein
MNHTSLHCSIVYFNNGIMNSEPNSEERKKYTKAARLTLERHDVPWEMIVCDTEEPDYVRFVLDMPEPYNPIADLLKRHQ